MKLIPITALALALAAHSSAQTAPATRDTLGRGDPRSSVTGFLEACGNRNYQRASQYLDLTDIAPPDRDVRGAELAQQLEDTLNSDPAFSVILLSRSPEGNRRQNPEPDRDRIASVTLNGAPVGLYMQRTALSPDGPWVWLFSRDTVAVIPKLAQSANAASATIAKYLPPLLSRVEIAETPLWKWLALVLAALLLVALARQFDRLLGAVAGMATSHSRVSAYVPWFQAIIKPLRVILSLLIFRLAVEVVVPAAVARVYIGRAAQGLLAYSVAWCLIRMVELYLARIEGSLDFASRSMLQLGRRTAKAAILVLTSLLVLSSWGYDTATLLAGLGVGGIAVALAAQQTISNVFGGISIIGDRPITVGEFGKFGDLIGTVEDIGMRSTRIRTLNRTLVSVPNSAFAGYSLENYSSRDKILFNPTFSIQRTTPEEQVLNLVAAIRNMLETNERVECVRTPVRVTGLTAAALNVEIFCYALTSDIDEFYTIQGDLLLAINRIMQEAAVELA